MSARMVSRGLLRAGVALIALSGPLAAQSMFAALMFAVVICACAI